MAFFPEDPTVYETMRKNMVESASPLITM